MKATVLAHADYSIAEIDPRLYGSFIEHLGRAVYTGIYEPEHPTADENGMRRDVIDLVREIDVPIVRYPGGNFVSAYNWEDGIGPKDQRPVRLDLAWHTSESNEVGLHEFSDWCSSVGTEMMLAVNLGSRGLDEARNFLEYANHPGGSYWSDLRIGNGRAEPFNVKLWCLGNEMDGPWQIGHKSADEYGRLAHETAKAMRSFDSSLELIVCGSSNAKMPTYPQWEATVLDHTYNEVDYISLHMYFDNKAGDTPNYLAQNKKLDDYIVSVSGVIDFIKAKKRSSKDVYISFDEWNVWYHSKEQDEKILKGNDGWPFAPPLLEDIYNFEDVLQVGLILNTFIRRSNVVRIACLAQLVNVIAPIMTAPGGEAWRQTIFYPYMFASRYGRGTALDLRVKSPTYEVADIGEVDSLDVAAVHDAEGGFLSFFVVNRSQTAIETAFDLQGFAAAPSIADYQVMTHADLKAVNSLEQMMEVAPRAGDGLVIDGASLAGTFPPMSYQMIRIKLQPAAQ
ncbi:arabinosylfuranosidase ArfA [Allorhizobium taibaishanense]|uniref:non-reducing end alpha-L-arabinofuranosidase n=1 Tax=Allorhizobium taibaishanense TaxID=887144 RepID=A0A1Q9A6B0_9HYPH|nr:alpha-N-arabinofuranosidase [Allorhizobium taibaishanense]MBB4008755.1 alpha-N-arabinofuranosidase [Allorhizobium taibaishanense]OLP50121.1 alpha-N-arabinofuranosidase [Allorhizobium taibaishanense]